MDHQKDREEMFVAPNIHSFNGSLRENYLSQYFESILQNQLKLTLRTNWKVGTFNMEHHYMEHDYS